MIEELSATQIIEATRSGALSCVELVEHFEKNVNRRNASINAISKLHEGRMTRALHLDQMSRSQRAELKLFGLPIVVKEMFCLEGQVTTAASKMLENFRPPYTATVVKKLEDQGAIVLGQCNQDEFAMGARNEFSLFGSCKNPWNRDHVTGGSSGGSAAAVASGMAPIALGTDTGGSIRQPASFCGVVGVKPTYGRCSRYGMIAFASSLDQAGPMAKSVSEAAMVLEVMCGQDELDGTTLDKEVPFWSQNFNSDLSAMKVGFVTKASLGPLSAEVERSYTEAKELLREAGARIVEVELPYFEHMVPVYYLISASEASSNLARYDGVRYGYRSDFSKEKTVDLEEFYSKTRGEGFGEEVKRRILLGTFCLSSGYYNEYYGKAAKVRRLIYQSYRQLMTRIDALVLPVTRSEAPLLGEDKDDPIEVYKQDHLTILANLTGAPAMSLPVGITESSLPVGMQVLADHFNEQKMFNVASAIEQQKKNWAEGKNV